MVIYEVYKTLRRDRSRFAAHDAVGQLATHTLAALTADLAVHAAELSLLHRLSMADAIVYAAAQACDALLVTGDEHFTGLPGVEVIAPPPS